MEEDPHLAAAHLVAARLLAIRADPQVDLEARHLVIRADLEAARHLVIRADLQVDHPAALQGVHLAAIKEGHRLLA